MSRSLDLDAARSLVRRPGVARLLAALDGGGEETRIVGGAVRNALLGRHVHEIDLATTSEPPETVRRAAAAGFRTVPTGIEHGTVTVLVSGEPFEVTTLREDVETDGRHAVVRFGRDFRADALRRDFTINALSVGQDGVLHDLTDGVADLAAARVRFIGEAGQRIREDYLRVLRFFRFTAEYGEGPADQDGLDASVRARDGLAVLSRERVRAEFLKLVVARRAAEVVGLLSEYGLLGRLTAGVGDLGRLARANGAASDPVGALAALLVRTDEDAERLRERLRLSNAETDRLVEHARLAAALVAPAVLDRDDIRRLAAEHGIDALVRTTAVLTGEPRPTLAEAGGEQFRRYADDTEPAPRFRLKGADLVRQGVPPGPEIGRRLAEARRVWLAAGCPDDEPGEGFTSS